jgi:hypothetical protein
MESSWLGFDPAIPLGGARPCDMIGIAGSSPAMTAYADHSSTRRRRALARSITITVSTTTITWAAVSP